MLQPFAATFATWNKKYKKEKDNSGCHSGVTEN